MLSLKTVLIAQNCIVIAEFTTGSDKADSVNSGHCIELHFLVVLSIARGEVKHSLYIILCRPHP